MHGGIRSKIGPNASGGLSYASSFQNEEQNQRSVNVSVEERLSFPEQYQAQLLKGETANAMSDDQEKLKMHLEMLRRKGTSWRGH